MSERRVFVICKEHGRQVAYVYTRGDRPPRADGRPRRQRKCRPCQRLASRAWYHFGGGRAKIAVSSARYKAANADKVREQGVAYRAANVRWDRPRKVATVALVLLYCFLTGVSPTSPSPWIRAHPLMGQGGRGPVFLMQNSGGVSNGIGVRLALPPPGATPGPPRPFLKSKPNPFDPCRWSPFFCGYIRGA